MPNGFKKNKIMTPAKVSSKPALAIRKYCGIKPSCGGMIIVNRIVMKSMFLAGKWNFAKAKPASELMNSTTRVTMEHKTKDVHKAPKKSICDNTFWKFSTIKFPGVIVGGMELYAELVWVAMTNIQ